MFLFLNSKHKLHKLKKTQCLSVYVVSYSTRFVYFMNSWRPNNLSCQFASMLNWTQGIDVKVIEETGD